MKMAFFKYAPEREMVVFWLNLKLSRLRSSMVSLQMYSPKLRKMRSAYERHSHFK